ncbi:MAG: hypothetical protein NVSMB59_24170 [Vulcanimicrobiaceae bacterium]
MADFQKHANDFARESIDVVAASVDSQDDASKVVRELGLTYPVAYGLDALRFARTHGAFYDATDPYVHATGFVIEPNGAIAVASYSNGSIGRLAAADCLKVIQHSR